jgi:hypothetical protein
VQRWTGTIRERAVFFRPMSTQDVRQRVFNLSWHRACGIQRRRRTSMSNPPVSRRIGLSARTNFLKIFAIEGRNLIGFDVGYVTNRVTPRRSKKMRDRNSLM